MGKHNYGGYSSKASLEFKSMFGNMVRSQREWIGRTQQQIGRYVGVTHKAISNYETGMSFPKSDDVFTAIINKLEFPKEYVYRLFDEGGDEVRKALLNDPKTKEMLKLRDEGLTNKRIAETLGTSVSEVYERIGKKADSVMIAEQNNKPIINVTKIDKVPEKESPKVVDLPVTIVEPEKKSLLTERRVVKIIDLEGSICNYRVDQRTGIIELLDFDDGVSLIKGALDKESIDILINELTELKGVL